MIKEKELIERLRRRDPEAYEILIDQYSRLLFSICAGILIDPGTREDVEDTVADCFLEFWENGNKFDPSKGSLKGYLFKDAKKNRVFVTDTPQPGAKTCQTNYTTLASANGLSLVECELITGRTHQIRAQFAHAGHPLLGDGKYGKLDKRFDRNYQALYAYKLTCDFTTDAGALEYLNGKTFQVAQVDFVKEYFPGISRLK